MGMVWKGACLGVNSSFNYWVEHILGLGERVVHTKGQFECLSNQPPEVTRQPQSADKQVPLEPEKGPEASEAQSTGAWQWPWSLWHIGGLVHWSFSRLHESSSRLHWNFSRLHCTGAAPDSTGSTAEVSPAPGCFRFTYGFHWQGFKWFKWSGSLSSEILKWQAPLQLNATIFIWRSTPTSLDVLISQNEVLSNWLNTVLPVKMKGGGSSSSVQYERAEVMSNYQSFRGRI